MTGEYDTPISFRPTADNLAQIAAIIAHYQRQGIRMNRTDAISAALAQTAERLRGETMNAKPTVTR